MHQLDLDKKQRKELLDFSGKLLENYYGHTRDFRVSADLNIEQLRDSIRSFDFSNANDFKTSIQYIIDSLQQYGVQTPHPSYYGLFNPRPTFASILSDLITATLNPQIAAWSHAPFAAEVENFLIEELALKFGYEQGAIDGVFASGGAEANLTAVISAIQKHFPEYKEYGAKSIKNQPVIYCSSEAHHSIHKSAIIAGLGKHAVVPIAANDQLQIDVRELERRFELDQRNGTQPFLLVATGGTTGPGAIDPLTELASFAKSKKLWFHVDAAYGGALILNSDHKKLLDGIQYADSITFDLHKWPSMPMATSVFISKHVGHLQKSFSLDADYMPKEAMEINISDPFSHSIQWSRRSIGLRFYLSLLFYGWKGFSDLIAAQMHKGKLLKRLLIENEWTILNHSELPIVCFADKDRTEDSAFTESIHKKILVSGKAWISLYKIGGFPSLRACITNYATTAQDLTDFIELLNQCRKASQ